MYFFWECSDCPHLNDVTENLLAHLSYWPVKGGQGDVIPLPGVGLNDDVTIPLIDEFIMFIDPWVLLLLSRPYGCPECGEIVQNNQRTCEGFHFCKVVPKILYLFNKYNNYSQA